MKCTSGFLGRFGNDIFLRRRNILERQNSESGRDEITLHCGHSVVEIPQPRPCISSLLEHPRAGIEGALQKPTLTTGPNLRMLMHGCLTGGRAPTFPIHPVILPADPFSGLNSPVIWNTLCLEQWDGKGRLTHLLFKDSSLITPTEARETVGCFSLCLWFKTEIRQSSY